MERGQAILEAAHVRLVDEAALRSRGQVLFEWVIIHLPIVNDDGTIEALHLIGVPIGMKKAWT